MVDPTQESKDKAAAEKAAAEKAAAEKAAAAKAAADAEAAKKSKGGKKAGHVKVKGMVNMSCKDGTRLEVGAETHLTQEEYDRLTADKRHAKKPFFSEA